MNRPVLISLLAKTVETVMKEEQQPWGRQLATIFEDHASNLRDKFGKYNDKEARKERRAKVQNDKNKVEKLAPKALTRDSANAGNLAQNKRASLKDLGAEAIICMKKTMLKYEYSATVEELMEDLKSEKHHAVTPEHCESYIQFLREDKKYTGDTL